MVMVQIYSGSTKMRRRSAGALLCPLSAKRIGAGKGRCEGFILKGREEEIMPRFESLEQELEFLDALPKMKTSEFKRAVSQYLRENAMQRADAAQRMMDLWTVVLNFQKQFKQFAESINKFMTVMAEKMTPARRRKLDS
jgi:hypothetical protein